MRIREITIENIRGIKLQRIPLDIHPNKPTFFVAPNGFGKTSIATAFNSMKQNKIELINEDRHQNDTFAEPSIIIADDSGNKYLANSTMNEITNIFSIFVINSQVRLKASTRNFGGFSSSTPSLIVEPIVLYKTIPGKYEFTYSYSEMKRALGRSAGKLALNLNANIIDPNFVRHVKNVKIELGCLFQNRNNVKLEAFLDKINLRQGTSAELSSYAVNEAASLLAIEAINEIIAEFDFMLCGLSLNQKLVNVIQLSACL